MTEISQPVVKRTQVSLAHELKAKGEHETLAKSSLILAKHLQLVYCLVELMSLSDGSYFRLVPNVDLEAITRFLMKRKSRKREKFCFHFSRRTKSYANLVIHGYIYNKKHVINILD